MVRFGMAAPLLGNRTRAFRPRRAGRGRAPADGNEKRASDEYLFARDAEFPAFWARNFTGNYSLSDIRRGTGAVSFSARRPRVDSLPGRRYNTCMARRLPRGRTAGGGGPRGGRQGWQQRFRYEKK